MSRAIVPKVDEDGEVIVPMSKVVQGAMTVAKDEKFIQFRGRAMVMVYDPYPHYVPLTMERFKQIAYPRLGGVTRSNIGDIYEYLSNTVEDLTHNENLILFGRTDIAEDGEAPDNHPDSVVTVWDMENLMTTTIPPDQCIWRSPYAKIARGTGENDKGPIPFIMQLAGDDPGVYDDIMQSLAPMVMKRKPDGVIWWVGDGANGKSTLMDAIYKIFPGQLSSITVKRLTDARDTPGLNGTLANIVKESSEGRIDDTEIYKSLGTHEDFPVHKFHSQESVTIHANLHHIFSANNIPVFADKGFSARRRTFIIPFSQTFESDPEFESKTFTPELFGRLVHEMCVYANRIKRQNYRYKFSAATLAAKMEYDTEANNAEEYARELVADGVVGFDSFGPVKLDYENWCSDNGYVALGATNLKRAIMSLGFERKTQRVQGGATTKRWVLPVAVASDMKALGGFRLGLYTQTGFEPEKKPEPVKPTVPQFKETAPVSEEEQKASTW